MSEHNGSDVTATGAVDGFTANVIAELIDKLKAQNRAQAARIAELEATNNALAAQALTAQQELAAADTDAKEVGE